jgi:aspartate/glutamate racemase
LGLKKVGLFGTRFTMERPFYSEVFSKQQIALSVPNTEEQAYIHEKYMTELVNGVFLPDTRQQLLTIAKRLQEREDIQGLILGGTELLQKMGAFLAGNLTSDYATACRVLPKRGRLSLLLSGIH